MPVAAVGGRRFLLLTHACFVGMLLRVSGSTLARAGLGGFCITSRIAPPSRPAVAAFLPTLPTGRRRGIYSASSSSSSSSSTSPNDGISPSAPSSEYTDTSTTRRRKRTGSGGPKLSRDFVGVAKATDTGRFRAYSAEQFIKGASGLPVTSKERPYFTVLGIETSCDDTGVAVVRSDGVILGEALASQYQIHEQWGGVVPGLARDAHASVIDSMVQEALSKAGLANAGEVDAIGVTVGPGLEICLRVGSETAKGLAEKYKKPFVAVHHLEAHCLMARLGQPLVEVEEEGLREEGGKEEGGVASTLPLARFPFLALLVSGGHCMILECGDVGRYRILGGTLDDALGEAYDKAARLLKVGSGAAGGPAMELLAREGNPKAVALPVPMKGKKNLNFSYAGLKNAFRMAVTRVRESQGGGEEGGKEGGELDHQTKADLAASFQNVAIQHLEDRLERAMKESEGRGIHTLAVVGGVAANQAIRTRLQALCEKRTVARKREIEKERAWVEEMEGGGEVTAATAAATAAAAVAEELPAWELVVPPPRLCTDNGVMVAWAAIEKLRLGYSDVLEGQDVHARWPFANLEKKKEEVEAVAGGGESRP